MADKSRKELLKQEDAFLHAASESALWVKHHRTIVAAGAVALVAVIGATWGFIEYTDARDKKASGLFAAALAVSGARVVSGDEKADPSAKPPTFASEAERTQAAEKAFQATIDAAPSSGVADLARFYVADLAAKADADKGLKAFEALAEHLSPDDNLYFLAVERAAYLHEQKGDAEAALKAWEKLTGSNKRFYADHALYQIARLSAEKGNVDKARELLGRIEKDFPSSAVLDEVQELYAQVGRPEAKAPETATAEGEGKDEGKKATP